MFLLPQASILLIALFFLLRGTYQYPALSDAACPQAENIEGVCGGTWNEAHYHQLNFSNTPIRSPSSGKMVAAFLHFESSLSTFPML
ncbi:hypothetical protein YC2023_068874 [Brassica napus]